MSVVGNLAILAGVGYLGMLCHEWTHKIVAEWLGFEATIDWRYGGLVANTYWRPESDTMETRIIAGAPLAIGIWLLSMLLLLARGPVSRWFLAVMAMFWVMYVSGGAVRGDIQSVITGAAPT